MPEPAHQVDFAFCDSKRDIKTYEDLAKRHGYRPWREAKIKLIEQAIFSTT